MIETSPHSMEKYRNKIEEHARVMENMGLSPVASRMYIYLLLAPGQEATFDELAGYFKVSKSAVSNGLKYLSTVGMIFSKTKGGQRKRYFAVDLSHMTGLNFVLDRMRQMRNMLEDIRQTRKGKDHFAKELQDLVYYYKMMMAEYPALLERWRKATDRTADKH